MDADNLDEITTILRRRYETGEYGHAHFRFNAVTKIRLERWFFGPDTTQLPIDPLLQLMAIPVVVDETMPDGAWTLVDNSTGETLHSDKEDTDGR